MTAPDAPGHYALHGAAIVGGATVFAFAHFQVGEALIDPAPTTNLAWSIGAFAVSAIILALVIGTGGRKRLARLAVLSRRPRRRTPSPRVEGEGHELTSTCRR